MRRFFLVMLIVLLCTPAVAEIHLEQPPENWAQDVLRITAIPVGEGDALLLECGGERMMVDGGPSARYHQLTGALDARGITHFKYMLHTHYHDDHINGLYHLMKNGYTAHEYLHPNSDYYVRKDELERRTVEMAQRKDIAVRRLYDGDTITLGGATIRLYRYWDIPNGNGRSMIERVEFGSASALLCADITGKTQEYFTANLPSDQLKADVIKIPHHGITPVNAEFMDVVDPQFAIVTNHREDVSQIITQLDGRGIPARYCADGAVILETDGSDWYVWQLEEIE